MTFDFGKARQVAKDLKKVASDCAGVSGVIKKNAGGVGQFLGGRTGDALAQSLTAWCRTTSGLESDMQSLAAQITKTANEWEAKEKAAAAAAAKLAQAAKSTAQTASSTLPGIIGTGCKIGF